MSQYASAAELEALGLPAEALDGVDATGFLTQASGMIDTYLRGRYKLPIQGVLAPANTFPPELRSACIAIATYDIVSFRGYNPDRESYDAAYKERRDFYLGNPERGTKGWLDKLAAGAVSIDSALDATPNVYEGGAVVANGSTRGWDDAAVNSGGGSSMVGEPQGYFWNLPKPD